MIADNVHGREARGHRCSRQYGEKGWGKANRWRMERKHVEQVMYAIEKRGCEVYEILRIGNGRRKDNSNGSAVRHDRAQT